MLPMATAMAPEANMFPADFPVEGAGVDGAGAVVLPAGAGAGAGAAPPPPILN